ncbi:hypothetical protein R1sor_014710 [Riccia sorocarpa]|uniref:FLYWCH-type domain-containing protein n=1 Tax=Riccia sorocarpa TaxID=122646 RepID=A0ABD3HBZ8_9MARC
MDQIFRFKTSRGRDAISFNGYSYRLDRRSASGDLFWRCLKEGCRGRLQTDVEMSQPVVRGADHSHPSSVEDDMIRVAYTRMRERAAYETTPIPLIYQDEANRLASSEAASAMLPVLQSLDTALYRARRQCLPPLPDSRADIVVPESLRFTEAGESFVLLQLLNNDIIVFGSPADFDVVCVATHVYMDGNIDILEYLKEAGRIIADKMA